MPAAIDDGLLTRVDGLSRGDVARKVRKVSGVPCRVRRCARERGADWKGAPGLDGSGSGAQSRALLSRAGCENLPSIQGAGRKQAGGAAKCNPWKALSADTPRTSWIWDSLGYPHGGELFMAPAKRGMEALRGGQVPVARERAKRPQAQA